MADLAHLWGGDLSWSASGDLAAAEGPALTEQRVLRRLLTSPGDYIWSKEYGAGLSTFVGQAGASLAIQATIRGEMSKEAAVAATPAPSIELTPDPSGSLYVHIRYADAASGATSVVVFTT